MFNLKLSTHELNLINQLVVKEKKNNDNPIENYIFDSVLEKISKADMVFIPITLKEKLNQTKDLIYDTANEIISILSREVNNGDDDEEIRSMYFDFMHGVMKLNRIVRSLDD